MPPTKNYLTKSKFLSGLQCRKKLWLSIHRPELAAPPSLKQENIFKSGYEFEDIVMKRYPEGVVIEYGNLDKMVSLTGDLINDNAPVIFQGAFYYDGVYVISDIIRRTPEGSWELKEVKSSSKVKDIHYPDLAIQKYILENNGLYVSDTYVIHMNYQGVSPDLDSLVTVEKTTQSVDHYRVQESLASFQELLLEESEPNVPIGTHCHDPYDCEFKEYCWKDVDSRSVFNIPGLFWNKREELYNSGIKTLDDLTPETKISKKQWEYVNRILNKTIDIDKGNIKSKLSELVYPIYFLDFETTSPIVPIWDGTHPYQRIPFQWSCHIMDESGDVEHREYIHPEDSDPRLNFTRALIDCIGNSGSVVVYNASFENGVIKDLARQFSEFSDKLLSISARLWDQLDIFKKYYKDYRFGSSNSIKSVLPVIDPELSHKNLELSSGDEADLFWYQMLGEKDPDKKSELKNNLLEYCKLDTWAMVVIHKHLKELK